VSSIWLETTGPEFPRLERDIAADVAVVGGGIVGVTTALLLHEAGARVVLIDANRIGHGVTGHTTAKVSSQHGLRYASLRSQHGAEAARAYGEANEQALEWIAARVERDRLDCDFRRRSAYVYSKEWSQIEDEARAASAAGLPAWFAESAPLPFDTGPAVRFADQAEFHPHKYLLGLVEQLPEVYERTHAVQVGDAVRTPGGAITARHTIVATHMPFPDRSLAFARVHPQRSYAITCRIADAPPDGMFISADEPTRSVRTVGELLLVGGEGHRPGAATADRYARLEAFAREHWDVQAVEHRWSSQDLLPADGLPLVGRLTPWEPSVLMATGFAKWGITNGTAAAHILTDLVLGRENPHASLFDPRRLHLRAGATKLVTENAKVAAHFVGDRLRDRGARELTDLAPSEGDIVRHAGERVAGYRDDDGALIAVSATCTHLGCQVRFNDAERTWDCPCHGSRFAVDGSVLEGPAVHRLERKPL
jgi:glycine/D-amino acid oxidase-like deaminating enzyme/nitrite reductase/ring-hydroxylating ferredoxin subunit